MYPHISTNTHTHIITFIRILREIFEVVEEVLDIENPHSVYTAKRHMYLKAEHISE